MKPRLVSFRLCPFVQRVAIALQLKGMAYDIEYVDLADPPDWFREISPRGKVPLLCIGDDVLFESAAISEFVDEMQEPRLHPEDPVRRAHDRAWMTLGNDCLWDLFRLSVVEDEESFDEVLSNLHAKVDGIESSVMARPFFHGESPSLVDATWAPLFQRLGYLDELRPGVLDASRHPRAMAWKDGLLAHEAVRRSHVPELRELYRVQLAKRQGHVSRFLDPSDRLPAGDRSIY